jgi:vanadium chloroperoxidase
VLEALYTTPDPTIATATTFQLGQLLKDLVNAFPNLDTLDPAYRFGIVVGKAILNLLALKPGEPGVQQDSFRPKNARYFFNDDPGNPVRLVPENPNDPNGAKVAAHVYHAPFYGLTAKRFAVQGSVNGAPIEHIIADPPVGFGVNNLDEYDDAIKDVIRMGGSPSSRLTLRRPDQTARAYFWAYDNSNLIGSPPRLYNQILRKVAWERKSGDATSEETNADFVRLFALANTAMADAGIFSWQEKYRFQFWRPEYGIRNDGRVGIADPFFFSLGSPDTNSNNISFKPPFPSYPSGHSTFGGAVFQMARLYYNRRDGTNHGPDEPDGIGFEFVSDELNGVNRDLHQPYDPTQPIANQPGTLRTRVERHFPSLWAAIFENAISRIWLGVHWSFDAFAPQDVLKAAPGGGFQTESDGTTAYRNPTDIRYVTLGPRIDRPGQLFPVGGAPLGIGIANDIFQSNLKPTPASLQPHVSTATN